MFRRKIEKTALSSDSATAVFNKIIGDDFQGDVSMVSTLRALIHERMADDEMLTYIYREKSPNGSNVKELGAKRAVEACLNRSPIVLEDSTGIFQILNFAHYDPESNDIAIDAFEEAFPEMYPQFRRIKKITDFYAKTFKVLCYVNEEKKNVVLFTSGMNIRKYHFLQCAIIAMFPWYFPEGGIVTPDEVAVAQSLKGKDPDEYLSAIDTIAEGFDLRSARIRQLLEGFETINQRQEIDRIEHRILDRQHDYNTYKDRLMELWRDMENLKAQALALNLSIGEQKESEVMEYFLTNKNLVLEYVDRDGRITFGVKCYLNSWDPDAADRMICNRNSYIYRPAGDDCSHIISNGDMNMLLRAIFIDRKLKMKFCSAYSICIGYPVEGVRHYDYSYEYKGYTPNPHIDLYACLGNHEAPIREHLENGDYVMAIEQCVESAGSLDFGDSYVMTGFMKRLYGITDETKEITCIELPDGELCDPKEAIEWLKSQNEEVE